MPAMSDFSSGTSFRNLILAALLAGAIVTFAHTGFEQLLARSASKAPQTATPAAISQEEAYREEERLARVAKQQRLKIEQEAQAAEEVRRQKKLQEALAARNLAAEQAAKAAKEAAWQRFYKKPKKCDNPADNSQIVECSNHVIREQQRFEKLYAAGKN